MAGPEPAVPRGALPTRTARRILRDFVARGLRPGDALADESTLLAEYGVARGTLREALRLLTFLGAVTVQSGRLGGPRLAKPGPATVGSALGMVVQFDGATLRTVFEARVAVEPAVAGLAAGNRTDADLALIDDSFAGLETTQRRRGPDYAAHAVDYTLRVAQASHNPVLATIVPALAAMTTTVPWRYPQGSRPELTSRVHTIVDAVRAGKSTAASEATRDMITWLMDSIDSSQPGKLESRILWPDVDEVLSGDRG
ncbi:FadR/GntR family transcriptional regulator [Amycolatopsis sp. Poz14]|uniref:FadR/GntR family transcriptional regulator n=1 Tax=Amycolatopsis sp. Poz14 TaxID=1447705 RepID=UPI001EE919A5|nr:FCD domain-containing protein [Amycolatopsis sp. Poz14]MCG3753943.1 FadR family transcriptional regulator [Amycolatopsis sp. Poz14]